jgi:hypothetical protein
LILQITTRLAHARALTQHISRGRSYFEQAKNDRRFNSWDVDHIALRAIDAFGTTSCKAVGSTWTFQLAVCGPTHRQVAPTVAPQHATRRLKRRVTATASRGNALNQTNPTLRPSRSQSRRNASRLATFRLLAGGSARSLNELIGNAEPTRLARRGPVTAQEVLGDSSKVKTKRRRERKIAGVRKDQGRAPCRPMGPGGRCRNHGGAATGPRTKAGRQRIAAA